MPSLEMLRVLLQSGAGADVAVVGEDCRLAAHSAVLASRSPALAAAIRRDAQHHLVLEMPETPADVLSPLLVFIYTGEPPQQRDVAPDLLVLADKFQLPTLKQICEQVMAEDLCVENAASYAVLSLHHSCSYLQKVAVSFIVERTMSVLRSDGWFEECQIDPRPLLKIARLVAAEAVQEASVEMLRTMLDRGGLTENEADPRLGEEGVSESDLLPESAAQWLPQAMF